MRGRPQSGQHHIKQIVDLKDRYMDIPVRSLVQFSISNEPHVGVRRWSRSQRFPAKLTLYVRVYQIRPAVSFISHLLGSQGSRIFTGLYGKTRPGVKCYRPVGSIHSRLSRPTKPSFPLLNRGTITLITQYRP